VSKLAAAGAVLVATAAFSVTQGAATAASGAAVGCPQGQVCVDVLAGGVEVSAIPESVIAQGGVSDPNGYQVRGNGPRDPCLRSDPITEGTALWQVLQDAGVTPGPSGHVTVQRPDGRGEITLSAADASLNGGGSYLDGEVPLFWGDGGDQQLNFARPLLADPPPCPATGSPAPGADSNAADIFFTNRDVVVEVYSGPSLSVRVHSAVQTTPPRRGVTFRAVTAGGSPAGASYTWQFGNGVTRRTGVDSVTYAYPAVDTGVWSVTVQVSTPDGAEGESRPVTMTVTSPTRPKPDRHPGSTSPGRGDPASDTASHASTGSDHHSGHLPGAAPGPTRSGVDTTGPTASAMTTGSSASSVRVVTARRAGGRPTSTTGTVISGQLLGDPRDLASARTTANLQRGSAPAVRASAGSAPTSKAALVLELAAVIALVAAGAARELRDRRR
jgi:hypothetical protein